MGVHELPSYIEARIRKIARQKGFISYTTTVNSGSQIGDGFMGEMLSVVLAGKCDINGSETDSKLNLLCKLAPSNLNRRKEFLADVAFEREAYFYNTLLPTFVEFQREKNVSEEDQFVAFPKCYVALADKENDEFAILMEDLRCDGFAMWPKAKPAPIENVRLVVRELGKFHGISFALKDQRPDEFAEFKKIDDILRKFFKSENMLKMFNASLDRSLNALRDEDHKRVLLNMKTNLSKYLESCLSETASEFSVIGHGDCWNNNILYRNNEKNIAKDVRFVDWQVIRYVSPVLDLLYHIFSATDKKLRDKEYENLLQLYHQTLSKTVKQLGSNPEELFTFGDLLGELKKHGHFAFVMAPMILQVSLADSSDLTNLDEMSDKMAQNDGDGVDLIKCLNESAQLEFNERLNDTISDVIKLGYYRELDELL